MDTPHHLTFSLQLDLWPKSHAPLTDGCDGCGCEASKERHQGGGIPIESETPYFRLAGWWFGTWLLFSIIYGMSSFPLTFIFFRGVGTTNRYMFHKRWMILKVEVSLRGGVWDRHDEPYRPHSHMRVIDHLHTFYQVPF